MIIRCADIAVQNNYNEEDFLAFCAHSSHAWWDCQENEYVTNHILLEYLKKDYTSYL